MSVGQFLFCFLVSGAGVRERSAEKRGGGEDLAPARGRDARGARGEGRGTEEGRTRGAAEGRALKKKSRITTHTPSGKKGASGARTLSRARPPPSLPPHPPKKPPEYAPPAARDRGLRGGSDGRGGGWRTRSPRNRSAARVRWRGPSSRRPGAGEEIFCTEQKKKGTSARTALSPQLRERARGRESKRTLAALTVRRASTRTEVRRCVFRWGGGGGRRGGEDEVSKEKRVRERIFWGGERARVSKSERLVARHAPGADPALPRAPGGCAWVGRSQRRRAPRPGGPRRGQDCVPKGAGWGEGRGQTTCPCPQKERRARARDLAEEQTHRDGASAGRAGHGEGHLC